MGNALAFELDDLGLNPQLSLIALDLSFQISKLKEVISKLKEELFLCRLVEMMCLVHKYLLSTFCVHWSAPLRQSSKHPCPYSAYILAMSTSGCRVPSVSVGDS